MRGYFFSFSAFFLVMLLTDQSSCHQKATANGSSIVPLSVGNYWIYRDSVFTDGQLTLVTNDTDKIVSTASWNDKTTFIFDEGKEWYQSNDTVYQLSRQRTGVKFPSPVMMVVAQEGTFNYVFGGDVVMQKTIVRLPDCPAGQWHSPACFKISDSCEGYMMISYGIGIIREKSSECFAGSKNYSTRTLIEVHLK